MSERPWIPLWQQRPPKGVEVETKIDDAKGVRCVQALKRGGITGLLWFAGNMYVYYEPTHWREMAAL